MPTVVRRGRRIAFAALLLIGYPLAAVDPKPADAAVLGRMKKDLYFLAGPECAGRASGGKEIEKATAYVVAAFKEAGLKPAGKDGSYIQPFIVYGRSAPGSPTSLKLTGSDGQNLILKYGGQFMATGLTGTGKATAGIVFAGYGLTADSPAYDDYKGIDAKGKFVVVLRRTPKYGEGSKNPFGLDGGKYAPLVYKLQNAIDHGAAGVIFVSDRSLAESDDPLMEYFAAGGGGSKIPVLHMKRYLLDHLLRAVQEKGLTDVEKAIDADLTPRSLDVTGWTAASEVTVKRSEMPCKNVAGYLDGSGPLADETIVIGAHYDHVGDGQFGSRDGAAGRGKIHWGADDNASGTTGLMELARRFGAMKERQGRRIVFLAFSAEERGLFGSIAYCKEPLFPLDKTVFMLNMDMIGRSIPVEDDDKKMKDRLLVWGVGTGEGFEKLVKEENKPFDFKLSTLAGGTGPSDHDSFYRKKIPVLFFYTGSHPDYHRPTDTPEKINYPAMKKVMEFAEAIATHFAMVPERPKYIQVTERWRDPTEDRTPAGQGRGGNAPTLGFMPGNYEEVGKGVLVEALTPGGAAEKGGVKPGDHIIEIAGQSVKDIGAYMTVMAGQKAGKQIEIKVLRKEKEEKLKVTPMAPGQR
ncbi:MAG TPA: M28 family peptidase [Fimbriiglobus sp.]